MSDSLKLSEAEFSIYENKLSSYSQFLSESIDTYISILDEVLSIGINDIKVTSAINELKEKLRPISQNIESSTSAVKNATSGFVSDVETEDRFNYSDEGMSSIFSILSMFLGG